MGKCKVRLNIQLTVLPAAGGSRLNIQPKSRLNIQPTVTGEILGVFLGVSKPAQRS